MYKSAFDAILAKNDLQNYILLYGDNFQNELYANLIKEKFGADETLCLYFEEYNFNKASDFLSLGSLFSEKKLLEIKLNKQTSDGKAKKISAKEVKEFSNLVEICKKNADNFLLLELYDANAKQSELEKVFNEKSGAVRFFAPNNINDGANLLRLKAKELNINITQSALIKLINIFDSNLYLAAAELNKFKDLSVDEEIISEFCDSLNFSTFDDFFTHLMNKQDIVYNLEKLLESMKEVDIILALYSEFFRIFKIFMSAKVYGRVDFKELFGVLPPPKVQNELSAFAFKLKLKQFKEIFNLLINCEYELKINAKNVEKKELLMATLLKLARLIKN